jgi:hypothetical protein
MQMAPHIEALQSDLAEIAALGDEATAQAAQRLSLALRSSVGLRMLDALTEAALELSAQIPSGHVEVRLAGQDPTLVFVGEQQAEAPAVAEDDQSARITLRLPESLKARLDAAAAREGVSVNTWLVRALSRAVSSPRPSVRVGNRLTGFGRS